MPKGVMLYLMDGAGMAIIQGELTEKQKQRNIEVAQATVAWAKDRGYLGAMFMGADEYSGDRLRAMRESYESIRAGGSGIWVANHGDFADIMPDLLDRAIMAHKGALIVDRYQQWFMPARDYLMNRARMVKWDPAVWLMPHYQRSIKAAHEHGNKAFSYFDPQGGQQVPEQHRRHRGMGMWKSGLDGTMTWAYVHIWTPTVRLDRPNTEGYVGVSAGQNAFVIRGPQGVLDKLSWEGYREGYDDARYLATLQGAMATATAAGEHAELVARTQRWLDNLSSGVGVSDRVDTTLGGRPSVQFDIQLTNDVNWGDAGVGFVTTRHGDQVTFAQGRDYRVWWIDGDVGEAMAVIVSAATTEHSFLEQAEELLDTLAFGPSAIIPTS